MEEPILDMSNTYLEHSIIIENFRSLVADKLKKSICRVFGEGMQFQWKETGDKIFTPDAFIICSFKHRTNTTLHEVPRMIMEVLSLGTEQYDRTEKLYAYNKAGVGEVWLVDWRLRKIEIYILGDEEQSADNPPRLYKTVTDENKEDLRLYNFPITKIDFDELFDLSVLEQ